MHHPTLTCCFHLLWIVQLSQKHYCATHSPHTWNIPTHCRLFTMQDVRWNGSNTCHCFHFLCLLTYDTFCISKSLLYKLCTQEKLQCLVCMEVVSEDKLYYKLSLWRRKSCHVSESLQKTRHTSDIFGSLTTVVSLQIYVIFY